MKAYRIRDWSKLYENNRTRELVYMEWVPIPNAHDGDGFSDLLDHPDGTSHFGAWVLLLQVASKCEKRGVLVRKLGDRLLPHDARSLARITHSSVPVFETAMERLMQIGWLEEVEIDAIGSVDAPHDPASACGIVPITAAASRTAVTIGTERNGTETERKNAPRAATQAAPPEPIDFDAEYRLAPWIRCDAKDPKRAAVNRTTLASLVTEHGEALVQRVAEVFRHREARKAYPDELIEGLAHAARAAAPEPEDPHEHAVRCALARYGWQRCIEVAGIGGVVPDAESALHVLGTANRPAGRAMLDKLGGQAAAGAA